MTAKTKAIVVHSHKKPSEKLLSAVRGSVLSFKTFTEQAAEAVEIGKKEGFTAKEVGDMIKEEVLKAGLSLRTAQRYLPPEFIIIIVPINPV